MIEFTNIILAYFSIKTTKKSFEQKREMEGLTQEKVDAKYRSTLGKIPESHALSLSDLNLLIKMNRDIFEVRDLIMKCHYHVSKHLLSVNNCVST